MLAALWCCFSLLCPPALSEDTPSAGRPKIGLALGGGGTRGLAHIGVLRQLEREGVKPDYICGTSMGAIIGAFYASGMSLDEIEKLFRDKSILRAYDTVPIPVRLALVPVFFVPHIFGHHPYDGLYKGNKFANYINKHLPPGHENIESLKIPFAAVASNLLDGKAYSINTGNVGRAIQASSAIPALRRPVPWQGKLFVDGGVVANVPVTFCRKMGADVVIAVDVDEKLMELDTDHFRKIGSVGNRCINMHLSKLDEPQIEKADVLIHPNVNGIELLSRNMKDITKCINAGEVATKEILPVIQERLEGKLCNQAK
jgi:NTE family protein